MGYSNSKNLLAQKSYKFSISIIIAYKLIVAEKKEFVLSKQLLKSGTAIGALIQESEYAQSKADFVNKLSISLKEANETKYWISLLHDTEYIEKKSYEELNSNVLELIALLVASIKTAKKSINRL